MKLTLFYISLLTMLVASAQAQSKFKTLNYLNSIRGKQIVSGQHNDQKNLECGESGATGASYWTDRVYSITGKYPALYGADFLFHGSSQLRWDITYEAERQWNAGAMVNIMWHACPPTQNASCGWDGGILSSLTAAQFSELLTNGTNLNTTWKNRVNEIAVHLQYLKSKGVEVLWRPYHEQNQTAFWWNSQGINNTKALWVMMHNYMTIELGLDNLIWVLDIQDIGGRTNYWDYNPGNQYWDIMALDVYSDAYSNAEYYNNMITAAGGKPVAIGECFNLPGSQVIDRFPQYSFFMNWAYGLKRTYAPECKPTNSDAFIREVYNNTKVITRDEMPGWNNVNAPVNLATRKPVTVSSTETGNNVAANAVDGSYTTRWSSAYSDAQWLQVDLGAFYNLNRIKISWEAAYGKDYSLQISQDGSNWTTLKNVNGNTSLLNDHTGLTGMGRYVRINGTARGTVYGYSIYELEVYGSPYVNQTPVVNITSPANNASFSTPASITITANASDADGSISKVDFYNGSTLLGSDNAAPYLFAWNNVPAGTYAITARAADNSGASTTSSVISLAVVNAVPSNLATNKPVSVSSTETGNNIATNAVDGSYSSRWSSAYSDPQWLQVDLGANYNLTRVKITWEAAYGKDYSLQISQDGSTWTNLKSITGNASLVNDHTGLTGVGRYLRINGTARATVYGYSIYELEVYGSPYVNQTPVVNITSPANNASFSTPASITISANASDADGSISKVDFYNGTTLLGSDNTAPYSFAWSSVATGTYTISARATDNFGATSNASIVSISVTNPVVTNNMKVVGYIANWIDLNSFSNTFDYSKVTHLNVAFENPNSNGDLSFNGGNASLISRAHANNVKVYVSLGGGSASEDATTRNIYFSLISDSRRAGFVAKLASYVRANNFDGIDVDLEGPAINGDYGKFIADLSNALKPMGKGLTSALSQGYGGGNVPSSSFAYFDWVNIMAYDATGPWAPNSPGQHSSFDFAKSNVEYWLGRGLPKSKAVLGLPFYGYGFNSASGEWPYSRIVSTYAGAENADQAGSVVYYNGIPTIKAKTNYAFDQQLGGVMIWEISEDAAGAKSLLLAIDQVMKTRSTPVPPNLATNKPVTVSSTEAGLNVATLAVDGSYSTRWSSAYSDAEWLYVDLGANYSLNRVKITWEVALGKDYVIQTSPNSSSWTTIKSIAGNTSLINDHGGLSGTGRYVRIQGITRGTVYGYSIYELEIYGTLSTTTPSVCGTIPAYSENGGYVAGSKVVNGGRQYECKPYPYSGWCNGASFAYAPGTGSSWQDAWIDRGICGARLAAQVEENSEIGVALFHPNPATDQVQLTLNENATVRIFNSRGILVLSQTDVNSEHQISLRDLSAGIYLLKIEVDGEVITSTLIKQ